MRKKLELHVKMVHGGVGLLPSTTSLPRDKEFNLVSIYLWYSHMSAIKPVEAGTIPIRDIEFNLVSLYLWYSHLSAIKPV